MRRRRTLEDESPGSIRNLPGETVGDYGKISEDSSEGSSDESNTIGWPRKGDTPSIPKRINRTAQKEYPYGNSSPHLVRKVPFSFTTDNNFVSARQEVQGHFPWKPVAYTLGSLAIIAVFVAFVHRSKENRNFDHDLVEILRKIKDRFPAQESTLWNKAYSAVNTPSNTTPTHPAVLLLLYSDDHATSDCLVSKIAEISTQYLLSETQSPLILDASDSDFKRKILENNDTFIEDYQNKVKDQVTMVVKNLQSLPSIIAEKLHFFCDQYEPLVPKAVYIFTMRVPYSDEKPTDVAEEAFKEAWGEAIHSDKLGPLITRLTSEVEFVKPENEKSLPC